MTRPAAFILGLGIGALATTPLAEVIARLLAGKNVRDMLLE
jgi:hypothetical protein